MAVWLRRAVQILLLSVFFVALMTAREIYRGESALRASDAAFHRGDLQESVLHARAAAQAYVPGAPHVAAGYERLEAIARGAEAEGRYDLARSAWGAVRSSVVQTSHWLIPRQDALERANQALTRLNRAAALQAEAGLLARGVPENAPPEPGASGAYGEPHLASHGGKLLRLGLLALGLAALALGLGWAGFRVLDAEGRVQRGGLLFASALCLGGAACWLFVVLTG
jgi:hypothetical protein